jgi:hypothetical protein
MESLKVDYFLAICELARVNRPLDEFGITPHLQTAIRWYLNGPPLYSHFVYKALVKAVMDARNC